MIKRPYRFYRKIYEENFGKIPKGYHVHHIDGNCDNNKPENLVALSPQEHYDVHLKQGDYAACALLMWQHLSLSEDERREIRSKSSKQVTKRLLESGQHLFQTNHPVHAMIERGTHHFQSSEFQSEQGKKSVKKSLQKGTHHFFSQINPNKELLVCPYCKKLGAKPGMIRWHFDNCKEKPNE